MTDDELDRHIRAIIAREGGWVNDPDDSGGPTNHGITLEMWREYKGYYDNYSRYPAKKASLRDATDAEVMDFYRWYFSTQGLAELIDEFSIPDELVPLVMDMRTLHSMDGCREILADARAIACESLLEAPIDHVEVFIAFARMRYMLEVAERRPKDRKFVRGWMHRALKAIGWWPPKPETREV